MLASKKDESFHFSMTNFFRVMSWYFRTIDSYCLYRNIITRGIRERSKQRFLKKSDGEALFKCMSYYFWYVKKRNENEKIIFCFKLPTLVLYCICICKCSPSMMTTKKRNYLPALNQVSILFLPNRRWLYELFCKKPISGMTWNFIEKNNKW